MKRESVFHSKKDLSSHYMNETPKWTIIEQNV